MSDTQDNQTPAPPTSLQKRGLIVNSSTVGVGQTLFGGSVVTTDGVGLDPQELRFALLFWDELLWPIIPMLGPPHTEHEQFLIMQGVLKRERLNIGGDLGAMVQASSAVALAAKEKVEPGAWAIAGGNLSFFANHHFAQPDTGWAVELYRALPVPKHDVPFAEILEFKAKRRDELLNLRQELDRLYVEVSASPNKFEALSGAHSGIDQACSDLLRVGGEWQFPIRLGSLEANFSIDIEKAISTGAKVVHNTSGHTNTATSYALGALAALGSQVKFTPKGFGWKGLKRSSPFRYVSKFHQEL